MRSTALVLTLGCLLRLACAVSVYLHPAPAIVPAQLVASRANLAISRHLGLERFDKFGDGDERWDNALLYDQGGLVGTAPRDALLVTVSDEDSKGKSLLTQTRTITQFLMRFHRHLAQQLSAHI